MATCRSPLTPLLFASPSSVRPSVSRTPIAAFSRVHDAAQIAHVRRVELPGLDRQDDLSGRGSVAFVEIDPAVDALVRALLSFSRTRTNEAERPPLELIWVGRGERLRIATETGSPMTLVGLGIASP